MYFQLNVYILVFTFLPFEFASVKVDLWGRELNLMVQEGAGGAAGILPRTI